MSRKTGSKNFLLPERVRSSLQSGLLLPLNKLEELKSIASPAVVQLTLRAIARAEQYDCRHPFWNAIGSTYTRILERIELLQEDYPDIARVIHNKEVRKGDILVSDFFTGLNFGFLSGGFEPTKVSVIEKKGEMLIGKVLRQGRIDSNEIGAFKNEIWYFISHRLTVVDRDMEWTRII